jgi:NTE family protein
MTARTGRGNAKRINIALQGGGAHGAFTWGVLDRLLSDDRVEIAGISGTSAGALNGAAVKSGLARGSAALAIETLDAVWSQIGAVTDERMTAWFDGISPRAVSYGIEMSAGYQFADGFSRAVSPYALPDISQSALRKIVAGLNLEAICSDRGPAFHVGATNVRTGKIRLFTRDDITPDAILASACLPTLFPAVEIDGEHYWDGGYTGNPALFPLFEPGLPRDIQNRINEISFNTSLLRELRAIAFVQRLVRNHVVQEGAMKDVLVHMISDDRLMRQLSVATKVVPNPVVMHQLRQAGHRSADAFLDRDFHRIGAESTVDLAEMFT